MKEEIQYKSYSIRLVTLIAIGILIIASFVIVNNISKNTKIAKQEEETVEVANAEESADEEQVVKRDITVSSRSEKREKTDENVTADDAETKQENQDEQEQVDDPETEVTYKKIEEVTISKTMDLTQSTGLSKEDFITLIANVKQDTSGFFEENAGKIYDICKEYSLNEIFFCGLISAESGWNIASNHRNTYNYISLMSNGKLIKFSSVEEGLQKAAERLHNNYLTPGGKFYYGKTLSAVKTKFCPSSKTWVDLVYGRMKQIINK